MTPRALIVDDDAAFIDAAVRVLQAEGFHVVGAAGSGAQAVELAERLEPDIVLVDIHLDDENGFDVVRQLASARARPANMLLLSTHSSADFAELIAESPVLGFLSKSKLSGHAVRGFLEDRTHGSGCRHEALVYSASDELVEGAVPFLRKGLEAGEVTLVVLREAGNKLLREALGADGSHVEYLDALDWYQSPTHAFEGYQRYMDEQFARGAERVRVVAEVIWSAAPPIEWKRYESRISAGLASVPASLICAYDSRELPNDLIETAERTHPLLRGRDGARPNARHTEAGHYLRELAVAQ
jgi:CheY-like chemotaxis protein